MDMLHLEHFLAVVEEGTLTRAAERVSRTQPAISQSLRRLEEEIGTPLFARDTHKVTLTEAGHVLSGYARRLLTMRDEAMRQVAELRTLKAGRLSIAAHEAAAVYLLPAALRTYLSLFPNIKVSIRRSRPAEIPRQAMDREVDIGFVKEEPTFRELHCVDVHTDEMVLVASPHHPIVGRNDVQIRDLGSEPFVIHQQCMATTDRILQLFAQHATPCRVVAELWSFENVKQFVREQVGLAIVPGITVRQELADGTPVRVPLRMQMPRRTLMVYRDQGYLSEPASELVRIVRACNWAQEAPAVAGVVPFEVPASDTRPPGIPRDTARVVAVHQPPPPPRPARASRP